MTGCSFTDVSAVILFHHYASTSCNRAFNCFFGTFLLVQIDLVAKKEHSFHEFKVLPCSVSDWISVPWLLATIMVQ